MAQGGGLYIYGSGAVATITDCNIYNNDRLTFQLTVFDEDTPQNLIALLQPDFIVKGGDYNPDDVVGSEIVKKRGGKVVIAPTLATYSTSKLVKNL